MPTNVWNEKGIVLNVNDNSPWFNGTESLLSSVALPNATVVEIGCGISYDCNRKVGIVPDPIPNGKSCYHSDPLSKE